jgi:glutathione transport system ATP-binding protein
VTATNQHTEQTTIAMPEQRIVQVQDLSVRFATSERVVDAVRNLSFHVDRGETWPWWANRARASRSRRWR